MEKSKKLIIVGASAFAEVAYEYFQNDSEYEVVAFSVEEKYIEHSEKFSLPVISMELTYLLMVVAQKVCNFKR